MNQRITDAKTTMANLHQAQATAQARLEAQLLAGESTIDVRQELATIAELIGDQQREIEAAQRDHDLEQRQRDQARADQIRLADQAAIAELTQPFTDFLKAHHE